MENMNGGKCGCSHHKVVPILMVLFAILFLLGDAGVLGADIVNAGWPIIVGVAGLTQIFSNSCKCC
ncbi:hypothetical protein D4R51_03700 [bacterium]|nr:MAG: hypothetical protein D4R51_03700 [bacterium]